MCYTSWGLVFSVLLDDIILLISTKNLGMFKFDMLVKAAL
jgi:hypothetical protein